MAEAYRKDLANIHDAGFGRFARGAAALLLEELPCQGFDRALVIDFSFWSEARFCFDKPCQRQEDDVRAGPWRPGPQIPGGRRGIPTVSRLQGGQAASLIFD
jgi:hypothetical protein